MRQLAAFVLALTLSLPFTGATGIAQAQTEIKVPMETPPGHIKTRSAIVFKETLEMGFFDYLTRLRMRDARELLTTTKIRVGDIGERVGYQSELSFVKAFKKVHDMTPRAFRLRDA